MVERRTRYPKTGSSNLSYVRNTRKNIEFFRSKKKNVVLTRCRCVHPPKCIRTPKNDHIRTFKIRPVVHVRVRWIIETRKYPACTLISKGWVARLCCSWLSFERSSHWDNKVYKIQNTKNRYNGIVRLDRKVSSKTQGHCVSEQVSQ